MLSPFLWALLSLLLLRLTERWIHRHLQLIGYQLSGSRSVALIIHAITLLPGVLLHELSHWVCALLLGVRTGRVSLLPVLSQDGRLQLGSVEYHTAGLDPIRESIIGAAPLMTGSAALILIADHLVGFPPMWTAGAAGDLDAAMSWLAAGLRTPDFWLWFYLAFAVANAMMPSAADRRAWPAFFAAVVLVTGVLLALGLDQWVVLALEGPVALGASYVAAAFTVTVTINLLVMGSIALLEKLLP